jgi:hypothetical protein
MFRRQDFDHFLAFLFRLISTRCPTQPPAATHKIPSFNPLFAKMANSFTFGK